MLYTTGGEEVEGTLQRLSSSSTVPRTAKSMEEVWKDINLSSLHNPNHSSTTDFRGVILQDFLGRPLSNESPTSIISGANNLNSCSDASPLPPPVTALSLNSGQEFNFLDNSDPLGPNSHSRANPISNVASFACPFEALASSSGLPMSFGKKRFQDSTDGGGSGDRRHKRMIKNRESAARSRARKQAYTNELELEVAHLMEENERLRRQQEQFCLAAAAKVPKRHALHRTLTAPF